MTLKELKKSISRLGSDNDSSEIILITMDKNKRKYGLLSAVGLINGHDAIFFADDEAAADMLNKGEKMVDDLRKQIEKDLEKE